MLGQANQMVIEEVGQVVGRALKWSAKRIQENIQHAAKRLAEKHRVRL